MKMRIDIFTLFPSMFEIPLNESIMGLAKEKGIVNYNVHNIRDYTHDKHKTADDTPYGGGSGMVMKIEPVVEAVRTVISNVQSEGKISPKVIIPSPQGRIFKQNIAKELSTENWLVFICGHYKGIDERVITALNAEEISIGDYVLTGGELPSLVIIDAVVRLIQGVLGDYISATTDSFYNNFLGEPVYTRPENFEGLKVPEVLLSGDHEKIRLWRKYESIKRTLERRPDIIDYNLISDEDKKIINLLQKEKKQ